MDPALTRETADSIRDSDPAKALTLYIEASNAGDARASSSAGYMLMVGEGIEADVAKARVYLERAIEGGDPTAMCNLGMLLSDSDPAKALELFEQAGENGNVTAMRNAAMMVRSNDPERAATWLEKAAEQDVTSMALLAFMLRYGEGIQADRDRAVQLYRRAAESGDRDSMYDLAMMLDSGEGVPMDRDEAETWFRKAAELGDNDARLCMGGILYEKGQMDEAEEFFTDAALEGDVKAMYNLALIYLDNSLGKYDREKGVEWLEEASGLGFAYAQSMLGTMLLDEGRTKEAAAFLKGAAEQGEPVAKYNLAALAVSGMYDMSTEDAIAMLKEASEEGVREAYELLRRLSSL